MTEPNVLFTIEGLWRVIRHNEDNILLEEFRFGKTVGKNRSATAGWRFEGYFPTVGEACKGILRRVAHDTNTTSVEALVKRIDYWGGLLLQLGKHHD